MDLVEFLRARLDEDERIARATQINNLKAEVSFHGTKSLSWDGDHDTYSTEGMPAPLAEHIAAHDPVRVLAEVEAKRRAVDECAYWNEKLAQEAANPSAHPQPGLGLILDAVNPILPALALPYADHPDYREEWRP
ncbi:DUF6221 family protein [Streptomyces griseofuscus]|uniref:Uncharacterized protein n=1 Tax=Streptomyces griseofuscus TaxID=146922 RepID=A0A426RZ05_9ACTN|nr:DUF6221 family protein [Streptomyces griseofuscus]RRQ81583.1 hypothetical protein CQW44_30765 [Streptomyces griseofuscus]